MAALTPPRLPLLPFLPSPAPLLIMARAVHTAGVCLRAVWDNCFHNLTSSGLLMGSFHNMILCPCSNVITLNPEIEEAIFGGRWPQLVRRIQR